MADPQRSGISASPDDAASRRSSSGGNGGRGRGSNGIPRGIGLNLILAIVVAALVLAGWFLASQHESLKASQVSLESAERRIMTLEDRLRVTDEAMTETGEDTKEKIGYWESEIRKLWAVSNDRNKKLIDGNIGAIKQIQQSLTTLESVQRELKVAIARHEASLNQQGDVLARLPEIETQLNQLVITQRELVDKMNGTQRSVASLQAGLSNRVSDNEQAIKAIDSYRLQLNNRLAQMERRLGP